MTTSAPPSSDVHLPAALQGERLRKAAIRVGAIVAVVVVIVVAGPGLGSVRQRLSHGDPAWLVLAGLLELGSCLSYIALFRVVFCRRMHWGLSYQIGMTELGANSLLPAGGVGGLALGGWVLHHRGMATERIVRRSGAFFLVTSAANVGGLAVVGVLVATGVLPGHAPVVFSIVPAAIAASAIAGVSAIPRLVDRLELRRDPAARPGRILRAAETIAASVRESLRLLREHNPLLVAGSLGYVGFDVAVLWASFHAFHYSPYIGPLVIAYLVGMLGGLIPIPGGIGGVDGALIGMLVLFRVPVAIATAAVLASRAIVLAVPAVLGVLASVQLRRTLHRWDEQEAQEALRRGAEAPAAA